MKTSTKIILGSGFVLAAVLAIVFYLKMSNATKKKETPTTATPEPENPLKLNLSGGGLNTGGGGLNTGSSLNLGGGLNLGNGITI
jgi:hypothetical protein